MNPTRRMIGPKSRWFLLALSSISVAYTAPSFATHSAAPAHQSPDNQQLAQANNPTAEADKLFAQGEEYFWHSDYSAAQDSWEQALTSYRAVNNPAGEAKTLSKLGTVFEATGYYDEASKYYWESSDVARAVSDRRAEAAALNGIATVIYYQERDWTTAIEYAEQSLAIYKEIEDLSGQAEVLNHLASPLYQLDQFTEAADYYSQSRAIYQTLEPQPGTAENLIDFGSYYLLTGDVEKGLKMAEQALTISQEMGYRAGISRALTWIGYSYELEKDYEQALGFYLQGLSIGREIGARRNTADTASVVARLLHHDELQNYEQAIDYYQESLSFYQEVGNSDREIYTLLRIGSAYEWLEQYDEALTYHNQALSKAQEARYRDQEIEARHRMAVAYASSDRYEEAIETYQESLAISRERGNGGNEGRVLRRIGNVYYQQQDYTRALEYYKLSRTIKRVLGDTEGEIAVSKDIANTLYYSQQYEQAASAYRDSYFLETQIGDLEGAADSANKIGVAYNALNEDELAIDYYIQGLEIIQTTDDKAYEITILSNIGISYESLGEVDQALDYFQKSLEVGKELGEAEAIISTLNRVANIYRKKESYEEAIEYYQQSLFLQKTTDDAATEVDTWSSIGVTYQAQGNEPAARQAYETAFSLYSQEDIKSMRRIYGLRSGFENYNFTTVLENLAKIYWDEQNFEKAATVLIAVSDLEEANLTEGFNSFGNLEPLARLSAAVNVVKTDGLISVHAGEIPENTVIAKVVLLNVLRRKGRTMEALATTSQRLWQGDSGLDQTTRNELSETYTAMADLYLKRDSYNSAREYEVEVQRLRSRITEINNTWIKEHQTSVASSPLITSEAVSVEGVQAQIPAEAALIEIVRYSPYGGQETSARYAAYVAAHQGNIRAVDLGNADDIDRQAAAFTQALRTRSADFRSISRQLDQQIMQPVRALVGSKTHLLISPDSQLNSIPFDALINEQDQYLIESYQTSYLNSGRDLLNMSRDRSSQQPPVIIADPNYDGPQTQLATVPTAIRSTDLSSLQVGPLPGTKNEAEAIADLLPNANVYMQQTATEELLKQLQAPSILHIATHGFFLPDTSPVLIAESNDRGIDVAPYNPSPTASERPAGFLENPLLRSGLALAGFNTRNSGSEDGVFTALEASGLNLHGTELVVLSACETGIGEVTTSEGIYGLRRAFTIAGAQSQLMSLWKVSDTGTARLMTLYYQNLVEKQQGRSEALRNAQLQMIESERYSNPFYWSAFIFSGDWRSL